jgi:hypothetical protein
MNVACEFNLRHYETVLQHVTTPDTLKKFVEFRLKNLSAPFHILDPDFHELAINFTDKVGPKPFSKRSQTILNHSQTVPKTFPCRSHEVATIVYLSLNVCLVF